jgi:hypothetical protein
MHTKFWSENLKETAHFEKLGAHNDMNFILLNVDRGHWPAVVNTVMNKAGWALPRSFLYL